MRAKYVNFPKEYRIRDMPVQEFIDLSEHKLWEYVKKVGTTDMKQVCKMPFKGPTGITAESAKIFKKQLYKRFGYDPSTGKDGPEEFAPDEEDFFE